MLCSPLLQQAEISDCGIVCLIEIYEGHISHLFENDSENKFIVNELGNVCTLDVHLVSVDIAIFNGKLVEIVGVINQIRSRDQGIGCPFIRNFIP